MKWQLAIEPEVEVDRQEQKHKRQETRTHAKRQTRESTSEMLQPLLDVRPASA